VDGHVRAKRGDLLGEGVPRFGAQPLDPLTQGHHGGIAQPLNLGVGQPPRQLQRRQPSPVEDLVRISVPDAVEEGRVGQGSLESVVLTSDGARKIFPGCRHDVDPAPIQLGQGRPPADDVHGRALLGARLGDDERAIRKVQGHQPDLARYLRVPWLPVEPSGDHEVQDEEELVRIELDHDAFPQPGDRSDPLTLSRPNRR
jgi:hypothetical protein